MGANVSAGISGKAAAVTPSDTADNYFLYLYIGVTGDVALTTTAGNLVTYKSVPAGAFLWVKTSKVMATNTTATNMIGHL